MQNFDIKPEPRIYNFTLNAYGVDPDATTIYDWGNEGLQAWFLQISNNTDGQVLHVYLNDWETPARIFGGTTQIFNHSDLYITKIEFGNFNMSGGTAIDVQFIVGLV